jgi:hypothetical protein
LDLWKRSAEVANIVSAAVALYVLFKPKAEAVSQVPAQTLDNIPLVILCIAVFSASVLNAVALRKKSGVSIGENLESAATPTPIGVLSSQQRFGGAQTVLPDGRTIISCSLKDLIAAYNDNTQEQFNRLLGGKWLKLSGSIRDNYGNGQLRLEQGFPHVVLQFGEGWEEQLSALPRGSSVTIRGQMLGSDSISIQLKECELL